MKRGYGLLLDTHIVIWMATEPERIPPLLRRTIEKVEKRLVSHATAWEIQIKHENHGRRFNFSLDDLEATMKAFACTELPVQYDDIRGLNRMRFLHADPFNRMLMSQAANRNVYLATLDQNILATFKTERSFFLFADKAREGR